MRVFFLFVLVMILLFHATLGKQEVYEKLFKSALNQEISKYAKTNVNKVDNLIKEASELLEEVETKMNEWKRMKIRDTEAKKYLEKSNIILKKESNTGFLTRIERLLAEDEIPEFERTELLRILNDFNSLHKASEPEFLQEVDEYEHLSEIANVNTGATIDLRKTSSTYDPTISLFKKSSSFSSLLSIIKSKTLFLNSLLSNLNLIISPEVLEAFTSPSFNIDKRNLPDNILEDNFAKGSCWACDFSESSCYLTLKFPKPIFVKAIEVEHSAFGKLSSAPKDFTIEGNTERGEEITLGNYSFSGIKERYKVFQQGATGIDELRLTVDSNHGEKSYTCIYRLRVFI